MTQAAPLLLSEPGPPAPSASAPPGKAHQGALAYDADRVITFPRGVLGFADRRHFVLTEVPGDTTVFKLLQSVDDPDLAFVVLPVEGAGGPISTADLVAACDALAFEWDSVAVLTIVTLRPEPGQVEFTTNLRAPLLIDTDRRIGHQHVFANETYPLRHPLPRVGEDAR